MESSTENLTLFESNKLILGELKTISAHLSLLADSQKQLTSQVSDLIYLLNGFTSGGASFNGYLPDAFVTAYLSVLGPVLAERLKEDKIGLEEMMKGGTLLARRLLEELSAYRSEQEGKDVLSDALELLNDPWKNDNRGNNGETKAE
jgi:hypothetical protein